MGHTMRLRMSILLLSLAACTAESTAPLAVPADVRRDEAPADTATPPPNPNVPDSKGSTMPVVRVPAVSKGSILPSV